MSISKEIIISELQKFGITNKLEQAYFLAQTDHESGGFKKFVEGHNYRYFSARTIFCPNANNPKSKSQKEHQRRLALINEMQKKMNHKDSDFVPQPFLFNTVYGSRMGNETNGVADDDGFEYRGGGLIQLTGKSNYQNFLNWLHKQGKCLDITIETIDDFVRTIEGAIISAIWFWQSNDCGASARADNITANTIKINGGTIGLEDRQAKVEKYKRALGC